MFNFSLWDLIRWAVSYPFTLLWNAIKVYWPRNHRNDTMLTDQLYGMADELQHFILYMKKGPVLLERYKIKNTLWETHIELRYISSEFSEQRRITFFIKRDEDHFSVLTGSNRAGSSRMYDKDKPFHELYADIMNDLYNTVELSYLGDWGHIDKFRDWRRDVLEPIKAKYGITEWEPIQCALIMSAHEPTHHRYIRAHKVLKRVYGWGEAKIAAWVDEIEGAYTAKVIADKLS